MRMRFRIDGWHYADLKTFGWVFDGEGEKSYGSCFQGVEKEEARKNWDETPKAEPGDVWRIHWHSNEGEPEGGIAGYAICCPGCGHVHNWTTANNCNAARRTYTYKDADGNDKESSVCIHSGVSSCWEWTGSAEEGTLTAAPSLKVIEHGPGTCGWHGFIQNGDLHE